MAQFASATFTGTDGTELSVADANWVKHAFNSAYDFVIVGNRVRHLSTTAVASSEYYHTGTPASADYSVSADLYIASAAGGDNGNGVAARLDPAALTFYFARYNGAGDVWQMYKWVAGSATQLGSNVAESLSASTTHEVRLECAGTAIKLYKQGSATASISVTDSSITAAGKAGLYMRGTGSDSAGIHIDNFSADDAAASGITGTGALTNSAVTASGSGTIAHTGTGAASTNVVTASGAGVISHTGTGSLTTTASTLSGTGTATGAGVTGTGAIAVGAVTSSGTGKLTHISTGALSSNVVSITGAGKLTHSGTGALTNSAATLSGSGFLGLGITGTGAIAIGNVVVSGTGNRIGWDAVPSAAGSWADASGGAGTWTDKVAASGTWN